MHKHTAAEMGRSGQIRDTNTKPKTRQMGVLENCNVFRDTSLKIGTVPENPGWTVTLRATEEENKRHDVVKTE